MKELPWVMDRVDFLDEPDANDVPFFVSKWVGEDVCFRFKYLIIEKIVILPIRDVCYGAHFSDGNPSDVFVRFLVFDWMHVDCHGVHLLLKSFGVILIVKAPLSLFAVNDRDVSVGHNSCGLLLPFQSCRRRCSGCSVW